MVQFQSIIAPQLEEQSIELPSWAFGNSGTRFRVFGTPGTARNPEEKIADAAQVNKYTGLVAEGRHPHPLGQGRRLRGPRRLRQRPRRRARNGELEHVPRRGLQVRLLTSSNPAVRQKAIDHHFECIDIMDATGSKDLKIWLADGTNYPGQDDIRGRQDRLAESLQTIYDRIGDDQRLVLEYKFFEPAFYHTDVPDWGTSYAQVAALGDKALVCLDTGHHAPGTNIEFIVAQLLRLGKLGSFDFNSRFYADDDLIVGAADPFQLFRILYEVIRGGGFGPDSVVAFMLDQCHNIEAKIAGQMRSVLNVQEMTARALLVDRDALTAAQESTTCWARMRAHGRVLHGCSRAAGRVARVSRSSGRPDRRLPGIRLSGEDLGRARRRPGQLGSVGTPGHGRSPATRLRDARADPHHGRHSPGH